MINICQICSYTWNPEFWYSCVLMHQPCMLFHSNRTERSEWVLCMRMYLHRFSCNVSVFSSLIKLMSLHIVLCLCTSMRMFLLVDRKSQHRSGVFIVLKNITDSMLFCRILLVMGCCGSEFLTEHDGSMRKLKARVRWFQLMHAVKSRVDDPKMGYLVVVPDIFSQTITEPRTKGWFGAPQVPDASYSHVADCAKLATFDLPNHQLVQTI
jgi:hypothetical protein